MALDGMERSWMTMMVVNNYVKEMMPKIKNILMWIKTSNIYQILKRHYFKLVNK